MKRLKVLGGRIYLKGNTYRAIIATYTKKKAVDIIKSKTYNIFSYNEFKNYWCETKNKIELELGLNNPEILFYEEKDYSKQYKEYKKEEKE